MQALVIDDSKTMRIILGRILSGIGFDVAEAADGRVGLDLLDAGLEPDLILVDWHMPVMTGLEFVQAVRRSPYDFTGQVMLVTTETEAAQIAEALDAGADEYLMKPFDEEAVVGKLRLLGMDV
jgi:two-component system chemotaxis response regulator CheY